MKKGLRSSVALFCFALLLLFSLAARAQGVLEGSLLIGGEGGSASLSAGKIWLKINQNGSGEFQAFLTGPSGAAPSGEIIAGHSAALIFGPGQVETRQGCDPYGPNPYLTLPPPVSEITCPAMITGVHYRGEFQGNEALAAELLSNHGLVRLVLPGAEGISLTATAKLEATGVIDGRRYIVAPIQSAQLVSGGSALRLTWAASAGARYVVRLKGSVEADWQPSGFAIIATSATAAIELPLPAAQQQFVQILRTF